MLFARSFCRCPYEKDIFISVDGGEAVCSAVRNERGRRSKEEEEKITTRVKGKSTNPVRRSHYRLGFDCSGWAGTGATRYTLSIPLPFDSSRSTQREREGIYVVVYTRRSVYMYVGSSARVSVGPEETSGRRKSRRGMSVDL